LGIESLRDPEAAKCAKSKGIAGERSEIPVCLSPIELLSQEPAGGPDHFEPFGRSRCEEGRPVMLREHRPCGGKAETGEEKTHQ
jgi:hypothetical protein